MQNHRKALSLLVASLAALFITGCCSSTTAKSTTRPSVSSSTASKPAPAPAPAAAAAKPAPAPAPAAAVAAKPAAGSGVCYTAFEQGGQKFLKGSMGFPSGVLESSGLLLEKTVPAEVLVGKPFTYEFKIVNLTDCPLANVTVWDKVTDNFQTSDSSPKADSVAGGIATWKFDTLGPRETKTVKVMGSASAEGTITTCGWAVYSPILCEPIKVVKPALELVKTMPEQVTQCDPIPVKLVVRNSGSSRLTAVKVTDSLPAGLTTDAGQSSASFDAGNLDPGQSKEFSFTAKASKTGNYTNPAKAASAEGVEAVAQDSVRVVKPALAIVCITPPLKDLSSGNFQAKYTEFIGRPFEVCFEVKNTGDAAAANTMVSVPVPSGLTFRSATEGGANNAGTVSWNVGSLAPGASKKVCVTLSGANGGKYDFTATAKGVCADPASTSCDIIIQGVNAILVEVVDDPDPIQVGESTTYTIKVTNQGGGLDLLDVRISATFPAEIDPATPSNGGTVAGKSVTWPPVPKLALKQTLTYTVKGKGLSAADARLKVEVTTQARQTPITELESTTVY